MSEVSVGVAPERPAQTAEDVTHGQWWYVPSTPATIQFGVNLPPEDTQQTQFFVEQFASWSTQLGQHYSSLAIDSLFRATANETFRSDGTQQVTVSTRAFNQDKDFLIAAFQDAQAQYQEQSLSERRRASPIVAAVTALFLVGGGVVVARAFTGDEATQQTAPAPATSAPATPGGLATTEQPPTEPGYTPAPSKTPEVNPSDGPTKSPSPNPSPQPSKSPGKSPSPPKQPPKNPNPAHGELNKNNTITFATLNVMGASHSDRPNGKNYGKYPKSPVRNKLTKNFILKHKADVLGLQELQKPQRAGIYSGKIKKRWGILPKKTNYRFHASENSMLWNKNKLKLLDHGSIKIPYFKGSALLPWAVFKIKKTGKVFATMNVHNPANTRNFPQQADNRAEATSIEKRKLTTYVVRRIATTVLGDWNAACDTRKNDEHSKSELAPHVLSENDMFEEVSAAYRGKATCYNNSKAIDLVFASKPGKLTEVVGVKKIPTGRMSDHSFAKISDVNVSGSINASKY